MQNNILNKIMAFTIILMSRPFFTTYGISIALLNIIIECGKEVSNEQKNIILEIRKDPTVSLQPSRLQGTGIEADLTLSSIDSITLSGVGGITVPDDLTTTRLELTNSSIGGIDIFNLDAQTLDVLISGIGGISVAGGQVDDQIITLLGILGDYDAEDLSSETVDVEIAGGKSATVRVSTTLNAHITGSGSVFYHGSPSVTRTGNGSGRVVQLRP